MRVTIKARQAEAQQAMNVAMSLNICVGRCNEEQMIPRLAAAGFDGLDFNFCDQVDRLNWEDADTVRRLLEGWLNVSRPLGLQWVQGHGPMFNMFGTSAKDEKGRQYSRASLQAAGILGVPWMVFHPDVFPGAFDASHRREVLRANVKFFQSLLDTCEKVGVGIAIENIFDSAGRHGGRGCPRFFGAVPEELCELIDAINHPLVGACWDTGHAKMMGLDPAVCLPAIGNRLKALHVQENDGRNDDHMLPFANGHDGVDWAKFVAGLAAAKYRGAFTYEVHNALAAVPEGLLDAALGFAAKIGQHFRQQLQMSPGA